MLLLLLEVLQEEGGVDEGPRWPDEVPVPSQKPPHIGHEEVVAQAQAHHCLTDLSHLAATQRRPSMVPHQQLLRRLGRQVLQALPQLWKALDRRAAARQPLGDACEVPHGLPLRPSQRLRDHEAEEPHGAAVALRRERALAQAVEALRGQQQRHVVQVALLLQQEDLLLACKS